MRMASQSAENNLEDSQLNVTGANKTRIYLEEMGANTQNRK